MIPREYIPAELACQRRWVTWRYILRDGKHTKPPDQATNNPRQWLTLTQATAHMKETHADGIGVILGRGLVGIDIDHCIDAEGNLNDIARDALDSFDTYAERSPSGNGIHLLLHVKFPKHSHNDRRRHFEIYDGSEGHARFFTITGHCYTDVMEIAKGPKVQKAFNAFCARHLAPGPEPDLADVSSNDGSGLDDATVMALLFAAKNAPKARRLFEHGDVTGYPSQSEADFALVRMLRFYTRDVMQLDRIFRSSALMRDKWDERHGAQTYGFITIAKAIAAGGSFFQSRRKTIIAPNSAFLVHTAWFMPLRGLGELPTCFMLSVARRANATVTAKARRSELSAELGITESYVTKIVRKVEATGIIRTEFDATGYTFYLSQGASSVDASPNNKKDAA